MDELSKIKNFANAASFRKKPKKEKNSYQNLVYI